MKLDYNNHVYRHGLVLLLMAFGECWGVTKKFVVSLLVMQVYLLFDPNKIAFF